MKPISEVQLQILEQLNNFRFLTVKQMIELGIAKNKETISRNIRILTDKEGKNGHIGFIDFGTFPTIGRLARIHYLLKKGAILLSEALQIDESEINHPKGVKMFSRDYFHRLQTIDLHISARKFSKQYSLVFDFFHTYYEHTGANHSNNPNQPKRQALTKIALQDSYFIPDCIFQMTDIDGKKWLFTGEIYRGHTTQRTQKQLLKHLVSLQYASISNTYGYHRAVKVLIVCEEQGAMLALQKRLRNDPLFNNVASFFLFATLEQIKDNFAGGWLDFNGNNRNLFVV